MSTLEFVAASADGIAESSVPLVTAPTLISGLGSHPAVTVPLVGGRIPAVEVMWRRLAETADFYGTEIPGADALSAALTGLLDRAGAVSAADVLAADVLVVPVGGRTQFLVSGTTITVHRAEPVALTVRDFAPEPAWRQLAANTTSRAGQDLDRRELAAAGFVDTADTDGDLIGRPRHGALFFDTPTGRVGTGSRTLELLIGAGLLEPLPVTDTPIEVPGGGAAWWVSPLFETHPVATIGTRRFEVTP